MTKRIESLTNMLLLIYLMTMHNNAGSIDSNKKYPNFLNGNCILVYLITKYWALANTLSSEHSHTMEEPMLLYIGTRIMLSTIPTVAPMTELMKMALSFFNGINV